LSQALPEAELTVIYGSTEAEPIATVSMQEVLDSPGKGHLVGRVADAAEVALVELSGRVPILEEDGIEPYRVPDGAFGELVVRGDHVLREYVDDPEATRETKLKTADGGVWHRTGDLAYFDEQGRIWLVGRLADRVRTDQGPLDPFVIEAELDALEGVRRSVLLAHKRAPHGEVLVLPDANADEAETLGKVSARLGELGFDLPVAIVDDVPVDARHNSKIDRRARRELRGR
jgi:acyl-CoA synthetase (AMP-forming)/AMP-acid ligase II